MNKDKSKVHGRRITRSTERSLSQKDDSETRGKYAKKILGSEMQSAVSMKGCYLGNGFDFLKVNDLESELRTLTSNVNRNDLSGLERMLAAQIYTLDQVFHILLRRALGDQVSLEYFKIHMNAALRAQSQARASIEAVAEIKNPKPFMQQQNIAYNQQVNNASRVEKGMANSGPRARSRILRSTNKLLSYEKESQYASLDDRRSGTPVPAYSEVEAVGKIHRPQNH